LGWGRGLRNRTAVAACKRYQNAGEEELEFHGCLGKVVRIWQSSGWGEKPGFFEKPGFYSFAVLRGERNRVSLRNQVSTLLQSSGGRETGFL
jgi:hypothetical protein